jgi:hypothetical protein
VAHCTPKICSRRTNAARPAAKSAGSGAATVAAAIAHHRRRQRVVSARQRLADQLGATERLHEMLEQLALANRLLRRRRAVEHAARRVEQQLVHGGGARAADTVGVANRDAQKAQRIARHTHKAELQHAGAHVARLLLLERRRVRAVGNDATHIELRRRPLSVDTFGGGEELIAAHHHTATALTDAANRRQTEREKWRECIPPHAKRSIAGAQSAEFERGQSRDAGGVAEHRALDQHGRIGRLLRQTRQQTHGSNAVTVVTAERRVGITDIVAREHGWKLARVRLQSGGDKGGHTRRNRGWKQRVVSLMMNTNNTEEKWVKHW